MQTGERQEQQLRLDITYIVNPRSESEPPFISTDELDRLAPTVVKHHQALKAGQGNCQDKGVPMLGWQSLPDELDDSYLGRVQEVADALASRVDAFVSLGIGGSYLGIEATIRALGYTFANQLGREERGNRPEIYFLGQNTDPDFFHDTLMALRGKRLGVNVISKSGTTAETAIAFRVFRGMLEAGYGAETARDLIIATTDKERGALRQLAGEKGYQTFVVPDDVGGRFSVLTDVGLVGLAVAGVDLKEFVSGFKEMKARTDTDDFWANPSMVHAAVRHLAYEKGKKIEVVATNSSHIYQLTRWMEQIFPESEGHQGYGMWVSPSMYSEKLHANGQMVQDGERNILETFLRLMSHEQSVEIPRDPDNLDGLNYLSDAGHDMGFINQMVIEGPAFAHFMGGTPNMTIEIPRRSAYCVGQFYYMMERSVALSGYLAGHNPFIQPGVEAYKKAMFALAGKPGTEDDAVAMRGAIGRFKKVIV